LVQLDPSQMKAATRFCGPLGLLAASKSLDERQFGCLIEADSSAEVVYDGIRGCCGAPWTCKNRIQTVVRLLEINSAAVQHKGKRDCNLAHQACIYSRQTAATDCIEVLKLVLARHKDALKEAADDGKLPAHHAAECGPIEVLVFVLGEFPEAAAVDNYSQNLLHLAVNCWPDEHRAAKVRLLCARYPAMMLQRDASGYTPLHRSCLTGGDMASTRLLCEAGGREVASAAILHPTNAQHIGNGGLPLHILIDQHPSTLKTTPLSEAADAFRLLLRLYPEAAGIEGGLGANTKTPYRLAVEKGLPAYYRRLLLRAAPQLDPAGLRRLNWAERRMAMFVAFAAVAKQATAPPLLTRLRVTDKQLVKHVVSFL
jgi:ankyrin repeat protein